GARMATPLDGLLHRRLMEILGDRMNEVMTRRAPAKSSNGFVPAQLRSLLVAVDLTPSSDRVLGRVVRLPLASDARITLLHVIPGGLTAREERSARQEANRALAAEQRHLRASLPRGVRVDSMIRVGATAKEIGAAAAKARAELILMG